MQFDIKHQMCLLLLQIFPFSLLDFNMIYYVRIFLFDEMNTINRREKKKPDIDVIFDICKQQWSERSAANMTGRNEKVRRRQIHTNEQHNTLSECVCVCACVYGTDFEQFYSYAYKH